MSEESKRLGCINRDENSVNNMIKLVKEKQKIKRQQPLKRVKKKASNVVKPVKKN